MYRSIAPSWSTLSSTCARRQLRPQLTCRRGYGSVIPAAISRPDISSILPAFFTSPGTATDDKTLREIFDNSEAWKQFQSKINNPNAPRTGLFHNDDLTNTQGFKKYATRTLYKAKRLVDRIVNAKTRSELIQVVRDLDQLSDLLCRVIDMADFVRSTHPDLQIQAAAHDAYATMFEYMNVLNTTTGLYTSLKRALEDTEVAASLTEEERVVAKILYNDFEKSGINLPSYVRQRWVKLNSETAELGAEFVNNMAPKRSYLTFDTSRLRGMDPIVVRGLQRHGKVTVETIGMTANHALRTVDDPKVRKELYLAGHTSSDKQIEVLEQLLRRRAELGRLVGRESFGHHTLVDKMAQTPEAVLGFLNALSSANLPAAQAELDIIAQLKNSLGSPGPVQPWDRDYYATKLVNSLRSKSKGTSTGSMDSYFSLGTVMQGLSRVLSRLYGIRFVPRELSPGETWNKDVRRLDVISETDGHIAVVYCDLFERKGKNPNPSHFTLRCSRRISEEEIGEAALLGERADDGMASALRRDTNHLYQLPTIALICDFKSHHDARKPTLLGFRDVQTLFHEMGHAVHSMLGRTALHNVSGTRCATDWAELPSVLMEHFAKDPQVLGLFARHHITDEPLPLALLKERLRLDSLQEASETRHQIVLALLDQHYNSALPLDPKFSSTDVYRSVEREFSLLPNPEGTSWQGFFGHLFGYGATYYSYLFDRAIAAHIWKDVFEANPLERRNGEVFKEEVLRWGGARDGWKSLAGVLRRPELEMGGEKAMTEVGRWGSELK